MSTFWQSIHRLSAYLLLLILGSFVLIHCREQTESVSEVLTEDTATYNNLLDRYVQQPDTAFRHQVVDTIPEDGFTTYVVRMVSQRWLTEAEVTDPVWWHWLTIAVPDQLQADEALLLIGGGSRERGQPTRADDMSAQITRATGSIVASLHNVPNQPMTFVGDDYGPRVEDELIAYGWRKFLENGARDEDAVWLARFPMTKAAVRAMDVVSEVSSSFAEKPVDAFVVAGASKRGWTTWTTAAVDRRVIGFVPIVIDLLNIEPSFDHHWRAYGAWAPAVSEYVDEEIMDWMGTAEFDRLLALTEPYSFLERYDRPKLLLNATGDQFFLPDSWQFYWNELPGEKHLRYVANGEHSLRETDALNTLVSFYQDVITETPRPEFDWSVEEGAIVIRTTAAHPPESIQLWQAHNPNARDFRVETIGRSWTATEIPLTADGVYRLEAPANPNGYTAFFGELTFKNGNGLPLKLSTGVQVTPNTYPHEPYEPRQLGR